MPAGIWNGGTDAGTLQVHPYATPVARCRVLRWARVVNGPADGLHDVVSCLTSFFCRATIGFRARQPARKLPLRTANSVAPGGNRVGEERRGGRRALFHVPRHPEDKLRLRRSGPPAGLTARTSTPPGRLLQSVAPRVPVPSTSGPARCGWRICRCLRWDAATVKGGSLQVTLRSWNGGQETP